MANGEHAKRTALAKDVPLPATCRAMSTSSGKHNSEQKIENDRKCNVACAREQRPGVQQ